MNQLDTKGVAVQQHNMITSELNFWRGELIEKAKNLRRDELASKGSSRSI